MVMQESFGTTTMIMILIMTIIIMKIMKIECRMFLTITSFLETETVFVVMTWLFLGVKTKYPGVTAAARTILIPSMYGQSIKKIQNCYYST